jgi:hypothetical protein
MARSVDRQNHSEYPQAAAPSKSRVKITLLIFNIRRLPMVLLEF